MHTWVGLVVLGPAEDLQWADDIHSVHALVERDQNLDGLIGLALARLLINCTHFAGIVWLWYSAAVAVV